jgi:hydrogenase maturation protease
MVMARLKEKHEQITKPVLIFGYGNLSRGDDALGPLLLERIKDKVDTDSIEILTDFQLQIEHALDLENRKLVLFIDASVSCKTAFDFFEIQANKDKSYTTHAMSPAAILQVYQSIKNQPSPPCFLLSIQGGSFELGEQLTLQAEDNLQHAVQFAEHLLEKTKVDFWRLQQKLINKVPDIA